MSVRSVLLLSVVVLAVSLRLVGLTRGNVDWGEGAASNEGGGTAFYTFHPDEETLVSASLELTSLADPPLTAYGTLPLLIARGTVGLAWLVSGTPSGLGSAPSRRSAFYGVRIAALAISMATLWLIWHLGRAVSGETGALTALLIAAAVPMAIQQAHFYTVDGLFTLLALAAILASLQALQEGQMRHYLLAGMLVGITAAVRLNGALAGLLLAGAHVCWGRINHASGFHGLAHRLRDRRIWLAGASAVAVLLSLEPYLVLEPGRLLEYVNTDDFGYSMRVARGEILRPWSLADHGTVPYLHFWRYLWPLSVGWPATLAFAVSAGVALVRRRPPELFLVAWLCLYFALIGGLHTKHVRYLFPMLPLLAVLAGSAWEAALGRGRALRRGLVAAVAAAAGVYTCLYGVAFARIYATEDSRIAAARLIREEVPPGATVGVERGGFSMESLVAPWRSTERLNTSVLFGTRGFLSCGATQEHLAVRMAGMDYLTLVEDNRYRQFAAVPDLYPAAASFYEHLISGAAGYDVVERLKVHPALGPLHWEDDGVEPSYTGYDHPAVVVLRRHPNADAALSDWRTALLGDPRCPDAALGRVAAAVRSGDLSRASSAVGQTLSNYPGWPVAHYLAAEIYGRSGEDIEFAKSITAIARAYEDLSLSAYLLPWASSRTLMGLDMLDLAVNVLTYAAENCRLFPADDKQKMARSYVSIGNGLSERGEPGLAERVYVLSVKIHPDAAVLNALADMALADDRYDQALEWWRASLRLRPRQVGVHERVASAAEEHGDVTIALAHLQEVARLNTIPNPTLRTRIARLREVSEAHGR